MSAIASLNGRHAFFVGLNTGLIEKGLPDQRFLEFYRSRSSAGLYCAIVGNVVVPNGYGSNASTPMITSDSVWADVAEAILSRGSVPGIQLATTWADYRGQRTFVSRDGGDFFEFARQLVGGLGQDAIDRTLDDFHAAAEIAVERGFRHVQVHAAHGYLPNLLVDDRINPLATRARESFATLAKWLRSREIESSIRISMRAGAPVFDASGADNFHAAMIELPFDFVDLSSGFYNIDKRLIYPSRPEIISARLAESLGLVIKNPARKFIVSGRISSAVSELPPNAHIGICRDLIANPKFLEEPGKGCRNHGKCHYSSRGQQHVTCPQWAMPR